MADSIYYAKYGGLGGSGGGVTSLNTLTGALTLVGTGGITISPSGTTITIDGSADELSIGPFGSTPNADGGTIAAGVLTLQPADGAHPGGISTLAQTLAGVKSFSSQALFSAGTVGLPGISFSVDDTTGIEGGVDVLNAVVSGVAALQMATSSGGFGNVGMGGLPSTSDTIPLLIARTQNSAGVIAQVNNDATSANSFAAFELYTDNGATGSLIGAYSTSSTVPPYIAALVVRSAGGAHHLSLMGGENSGDDIGLWTNGDFTSAGQGWNFNADKSMSFVQQISTPTTPASGQAKLYQKSDGRLYQKSAAGTERILGSSDTTGTVTAVSVASSNGFAGSSSGGATPALTLSTTITGLLIGNGTAISAQAVGNLTDAGTDGITIGSGTGAVLGSGTTISQHVADTTHNGYLASGDWNTFNSKGSGSVTSVAMTVPTFLSISGSPITTSGTLALTLSGTALPIANGGTGQTTAAAAFNALSPMTTGGDLIYGGASGAGTRLANGSAGQYLQSAGTTLAPAWVTLVPAALAVATKTVAYTTLATDNLLLFNMSGSSNAAYAVTLLTAVGNTGLVQTLTYTVGTGILSVKTTSSQTIGGIASNVITMGTVNDTITVISDGTNWQIRDCKISVTGRYTGVSVAAPITSADELLTYTTKSTDPLSQYSAGTLTIGIPGRYLVIAKLLISSTTVTGDADGLAIYGGAAGTTVLSRSYTITSITQNESCVQISDIITCAHGDLITININSQNTSPTVINSATAATLAWSWQGF